MGDLKITPLKGDPQTIDEVAGECDTVHIERMNKHRYFVRLGDEAFEFVSANPAKGPGIRLVKLPY